MGKHIKKFDSVSDAINTSQDTPLVCTVDGITDKTMFASKNDFSFGVKIASDNNEFIEGCSPVPNNEIWYTSSDGNIIESERVLLDSLVSNTYSDGKGVLTFSSDLTEIGMDAFYRCTGLTSVTIPNSVTSIGSMAFAGCSGLTSVTIPNSVTSIGHGAFMSCYGLTSVTIPNSVTSIGDFAFYGCSGLTSVTIPNSVTSIGSYAFSGCTGLTSVTIPNSVTSIGSSAFEGCTGLTSVTIPNSVTSIGSSAFEGCSLKYVTLSNSLTNIAGSAFSGCTHLTKVTIPESVTSFNIKVFYGCTNLDTIICKPIVPPTIGSDNIPSTIKKIVVSPLSIEQYKTATNWSQFADKFVAEHVPHNEIWYTSSDGNTIMTDDTDGLDWFTSAGLVSNTYTDGKGVMTFSSDLTEIGAFAFSDCSGLTYVTIPNSVTSIGGSAFDGCSGLTSVTIPNSVTSIGASAFSDCSGLTSVTIPNSVTSIGDYAFFGCSGLPVVDNIRYANTYLVKTIDKTLSSYNIKQGTRIIGSYAFSDCSSLTSVTIPNSVTSIGDYAFYYCSGLTSVTIPNSVTSIGSMAFAGCSGLTYVTIPNSVTSIGTSAFSDCSGLTSVTIPNSVTSIGYEAFSCCSGLTSVTIPNSVTSIGNFAFEYCRNLTSLSIPNSVTSIGSSAFQYCSRLNSVTIEAATPPTLSSTDDIPSNVTTIYVPAESLAAYKSATNWSSFASKFVGRITSKDLTPGTFVDLGLSVNWASSNMGTKRPDKYGTYYQWGRLVGNTYPDEENTINFYNEDDEWEDFIKYTNDEYDELCTYNLYCGDDVVYKNYGSSCHTPKQSEMNELINGTRLYWCKYNSSYGLLLKSKTNGNKIFIPAAGYWNGDNISLAYRFYLQGQEIRLWTSTHGNYRYKSSSVKAIIGFDMQLNALDHRYYGYPIRAVKSKS